MALKHLLLVVVVFLFIQFSRAIEETTIQHTFDDEKELEICEDSWRHYPTYSVSVSLDDKTISGIENGQMKSNLVKAYTDYAARNISISYDNNTNRFCLTDTTPDKWWDKKVLLFRINESPYGATISVMKHLIAVFGAPKVVSQGNVVVTEGEPGELQCKATGYPNLVVELISKVPGVPSIVGESGSDSVSQPVPASVTYRNASGTTFTCVARISTGNKSVELTRKLDVQFPPIVSEFTKVIPVEVGTAVNVTATVDSNPRAEMTCNLWNVGETRKVGFSSAGPYRYLVNIFIPEIHAKSMGTYSCVANNSLGTSETSLFLTDRPFNVHIVSNASDVVFCNYYKLEWMAQSRAPITSAEVFVQEIGESKPSWYQKIDLSAQEPGTVDEKRGWLRGIRQHVRNLTEETSYTLRLQKVCNRHQCWNYGDVGEGDTKSLLKEVEGPMPVREIDIHTPKCGNQNIASPYDQYRTLNSIESNSLKGSNNDQNGSPDTTKAFRGIAYYSVLVIVLMSQVVLLTY